MRREGKPHRGGVFVGNAHWPNRLAAADRLDRTALRALPDERKALALDQRVDARQVARLDEVHGIHDTTKASVSGQGSSIPDVGVELEVCRKAAVRLLAHAIHLDSVTLGGGIEDQVLNLWVRLTLTLTLPVGQQWTARRCHEQEAIWRRGHVRERWT
jgi:hypothetical protein